MSGIVSALVSNNRYESDYVTKMDQLNAQVEKSGFLGSRWEVLVSAIDIYVGHIFMTLQTLVEGVVIKSVSLLFKGEIKASWNQFSDEFVHLINCIKRVVALPFFFIGALFLTKDACKEAQKAVHEVKDPALQNYLDELAKLKKEISTHGLTKAALEARLQQLEEEYPGQSGEEVMHLRSYMHGLAGAHSFALRWVQILTARRVEMEMEGGSTEYHHIARPGIYTGIILGYPQRLCFHLEDLRRPDESLSWETLEIKFANYSRVVPLVGYFETADAECMERERLYGEHSTVPRLPFATGLGGVPEGMHEGANLVRTSIPLAFTEEGDLFIFVISEHEQGVCVLPEEGLIQQESYEEKLSGINKTLEHALNEDLNVSDRDRIMDAPMTTDHAWYENAGVRVKLCTQAQRDQLAGQGKWIKYDDAILHKLPPRQQALLKGCLNIKVIEENYAKWRNMVQPRAEAHAAADPMRSHTPSDKGASDEQNAQMVRQPTSAASGGDPEDDASIHSGKSQE